MNKLNKFFYRSNIIYQSVQYIKYFKECLIHSISPHRCYSCDHICFGEELCAPCLQSLRFMRAGCIVCGLHTPSPKLVDDPWCVTYKCDGCREKSVVYDAMRALAAYNDTMKNIILKLKYANQTMSSAWIATELRQQYQHDLTECDMIIPVPLHWKRIAERGYNQASLIAIHMSKATHIPYSEPLIRVISTIPQGQMSPEARRDNVTQYCFAVRDCDMSIKDKTIALIDDVMASGATVDSCARRLKQGGAKKVIILVAAKTISLHEMESETYSLSHTQF